MQRIPRQKIIALLLIGSITLLPAGPLLAANPPANATSARPASIAPLAIRDVALEPGGVLRGQVVDQQGAPCAGLPVAMIKSGAGSATAVAGKTDAHGRFQFEGLSAGVYQVGTANGCTVCRVWAPQTAPPSAVPAAMIVHGEGPVRGNLGGIGPWGWGLIGLGVAAAIAIPFLLHDDAS
jgi:hypothetical protein